MTKSAKPVPDGSLGATPYLAVAGAADAIAFYRQAFGAVETMRIAGPDGKIGHAELKLGAATLMLADESPAMGIHGPLTLGGSPVTVHLYVDDVDAFTTRAVAAGLKIVKPVADQFYGDRGGKFVDPFGHLWWFASRIENLSNDEIQQRAQSLFGN
ncbi:VOC family protein [Solimonas terrae]|uniref:VOC family protein n=1 Tax=Solimonas terrae TaxID=1396819 RepID=A0A6M2BUN3_9GAMM|nr:VOC family protein [Solimonas terrae]NGY05823.1 VOC family protein [Solimonas terrae]